MTNNIEGYGTEMDEKLQDKIYLNIKKYLNCNRMSMEVLSKKIGKSGSYLAQVRDRRVSLSITVLNHMATALGVKLSDLTEKDPFQIDELEKNLMVESLKSKIRKKQNET